MSRIGEMKLGVLEDGGEGGGGGGILRISSF